MKFDIYLQKTSNLVGENRLLKLFVVLIGVTTVINSFFTYAAMQQQRTVIVPVGMATESFEVQGGTLSDVYVRIMTRYTMGLFSTYTPERVHAQYSELLNMFAASSYPDYKERLTTLADDILSTRTTGVFYIQNIEIKGQAIEVTGIKRQFNKESQSVFDAVVKFTINYEVENGAFRIIKIGESNDKV
jgi:conjugal transfer pilus assembly protein TraE